ncbi:MAG TPA: hypothetical protein VK737_01460 [Opitutales bacterium]|jgi:hypothetical protein|nr:hypothetical protein [Opitutales bacterium]
MQFNFNIAGIGAVSPAGLGLGSLLDGSVPRRQNWPVLAPSAPTVAAGCVDPTLPCWARWRQIPRLRRVGSQTLFLLEAVDEAIRRANLPADATIGLSVAFGNGVLTLTRKFYEGVVRAGIDGANPAWFPETVFNAPLNHTLGALGRTGPSSAWVGDATALAQAWVNAALWLEQGNVDAVVVAAAEEVDEAMMEVSLRAGWFRPTSKVFPAEGAVAFVLTRDGPAQTQGNFHIHSGLPWRRLTDAPAALAEVLADFDPAWPMYAGPMPPPGPAREAWKQRPARSDWPAPWPYLGEAHSVAAGWTLARILANAPKEKFAVVLPLWGAGHQVAALGWESLQSCVTR